MRPLVSTQAIEPLQMPNALCREEATVYTEAVPDQSGSQSKGGRPWSFDREHALEAAMLLFWERGFASVSIADLTAAMAIRPASLYAAFGSKADLYRSARTRYFEREEPLWRVPTGGPLRAAIDDFFDLAVKVVTRPGRPRGCMIASGFIEFALDEHDLAVETRAHRDRARQELLQLLNAGLAAGELEPEADPDILARFLATVAEGLSIQARDGATMCELQAVGRAAAAGLPWTPTGTEASEGC